MDTNDVKSILRLTVQVTKVYKMKEPLVSELTIPHASPLYHYPKDMSPETDVFENIFLPRLCYYY
jgi:hypothetical protein